jgi:hypothetical protein
MCIIRTSSCPSRGRGAAERREAAPSQFSAGDHSGSPSEHLGSGREGFGSGRERLGSGSERLGSGSEGLGSGRERLGSGSEGLGQGSERFGSGSERLGSGSEGLGQGSEGLGSGSERFASDRDPRSCTCKGVFWPEQGMSDAGCRGMDGAAHSPSGCVAAVSVFFSSLVGGWGCAPLSGFAWSFMMARIALAAATASMTICSSLGSSPTTRTGTP